MKKYYCDICKNYIDGKIYQIDRYILENISKNTLDLCKNCAYKIGNFIEKLYK